VPDGQAAVNRATLVHWVQGLRLWVRNEDLANASRQSEGREPHAERAVLIKVQEADRGLARHEAQVRLVQDEQIVDLRVKLLPDRLQAADTVEWLYETGIGTLRTRPLGLANPCGSPDVEVRPGPQMKVDKS
jgi:hypothetical protein